MLGLGAFLSIRCQNRREVAVLLSTPAVCMARADSVKSPNFSREALKQAKDQDSSGATRLVPKMFSHDLKSTCL